ncbi:MAG: hypothetical protein APR54_03605 [Candidatus Cloacimonas sp. SDB]|nr:MAG: hypothetical protein APR54_03605 [Candidatus Cloacimonas sp. SDB]
MQKLNGESKNLITENIEKLKQLFPEVFSEGKVQMEVLESLLGEYRETEQERYSFTWNGKAMARREAQKVSTGTLRPCPEESVDWDTTQNLYIEGDNLEVLKLLQKSYHSKIKMIYIDPPYNTGKDFVYKDNYHDNLQNYKELTGQTDEEGRRLSTNSETAGRYHSNWLNMMYPRLKLARNLLREDGVIFISIDDNEVHNLRKICDEIFGEENLVAKFDWRKKTGANDAKDIAIITETIYLYAKNLPITIENSIWARDESSINQKRYSLSDEFLETRGKFYFDTLDRGGLQYSDSMNFGIKAPDGGIIFPNGRSTFVNDGWIWKWGKEKVQWGIENKFLEFVTSTKSEGSEYTIKYKVYQNVDNEGNFRKSSGRAYTNLITAPINQQGNSDFSNLFEGKIYFSNPKPIGLIRYLLKTISNNSTNSKEIILDFFSGSSTTAHAVMELNKEDASTDSAQVYGNRKYIMVQLPEPTDENSEAYKAGYKTISDIGKERIRRAADKIKQELKAGKVKGEKEKAESPLFEKMEEQSSVPSACQAEVPEFPERRLVNSVVNNLDLGFKVFKLDSSNLKAWDPATKDLEQSLYDAISNIKEDRDEDDVLYEILLKFGLDLTLPIEEKLIANNKVFNIGAGALLVCLAENISLDVVEGIGKLKEELNPETCRVVFKDNGFKDDVVKTNAMQIMKRYGIEEVRSI